MKLNLIQVHTISMAVPILVIFFLQHNIVRPPNQPPKHSSSKYPKHSTENRLNMRGSHTLRHSYISESWLKPTVNDHVIRIENYMPPFRPDRNDRPGGGVIVYVRDTLSCKRRVDLEVLRVEGVWLELTSKSKRILVGGFYRPPNSSLEYFNLLKKSIDRACCTNITKMFCDQHDYHD